jgi:CheY-like chemotaxis protein
MKVIWKNWDLRLPVNSSMEKRQWNLPKKIEPHLILMDIALEGEMDGIQAMKEIRKFSDVPVIYITGNSDPQHRERAKSNRIS